MRILPTSFDLLLKGHVTYVIERVQKHLYVREFGTCGVESEVNAACAEPRSRATLVHFRLSIKQQGQSFQCPSPGFDLNLDSMPAAYICDVRSSGCHEVHD